MGSRNDGAFKLKQENKGMILPMTLVMVFILTLLVLSLMQTIFFYHKVDLQVEKKHDAFYRLETASHQLIRRGFSSDCLLEDRSPNANVAYLVDHNTCVFTDDGWDYSYVASDLGVHPCLKINTEASHHWLLSIASLRPPFMVLQLRMAEAVGPMPCTSSSSRSIEAGIVSWRFMDEK